MPSENDDARTFKVGQRITVTARKQRPAAVHRLSAQRIVDVAISQMRENGYDAVTMRSIARELGTGPASLYAHVANRAELDQLVVGWVCSQWQIPDPDPERWDDLLRAAMIDLLEVYRANPGVARCTLGMIPTEPALFAVTDRLAGLLKSGGVPDQYCAWFLDVSALFVASVAVEEDIWRERHRGQDPDAVAEVTEEEMVAEIRKIFESLPPDRFPHLSSMAVAMTSGSGDERFEFGVNLLVSGLKAMADSS